MGEQRISTKRPAAGKHLLDLWDVRFFVWQLAKPLGQQSKTTTELVSFSFFESPGRFRGLNAHVKMDAMGWSHTDSW
jgi:hypothetical protein